MIKSVFNIPPVAPRSFPVLGRFSAGVSPKALVVPMVSSSMMISFSQILSLASSTRFNGSSLLLLYLYRGLTRLSELNGLVPMTAVSAKERRVFPGRKEGGQPANTNALRHGIYSRHFTPEENLALDRDVAGSLKDEAEILRLTIAGAADSVLRQPQADFPFRDHVFALRTISIAIARLVSIILTRLSVFGDPDRREKQVDAMLVLMEREEQDQGLHQEGSAQIARGSQPFAGSVAGEAVPKPSPEAGRSAPQSSKNKRGGQLGNSNALKHGFYARAFTPSEKDLLKADDLDQLRGEEALLHVLVLRVWRSLRSVLPGGITWQEYLFTLRCITYATFVIEKLQRVRRRLFGDSTELEKDIRQGLDEARKDLGINDFLHPQEENGFDSP